MSGPSELLTGLTAAPERTPTPPPRSLGLALISLLAVLLAAAFCAWVLTGVRGALIAEKVHTGWMDYALTLLGLLPLLLLIPVLRGLRLAGWAGAALKRRDYVSARLNAFESRTASWVAIGWAGALLVVALVIFFVIANKLAVGKTFFDLNLIFGSALEVLKAFLTNIFIFVVAEILVLIWGLVVAVGRLIPGRAGRPIRLLATAYTDVFRGLPAIITIYLVGFGLPLTGLTDGFTNWVNNSALYTWTQNVLGVDLVSSLWALIALTLTYGAYVAEVYRSGIESIHPSQVSAARSLGLSFGQTLRFVVVPQAVRRIIPPLLNDFIGLQKDTALVNVIGSIDAFNQAKIIASNRFNLSAVTTVAILFVIITIPQARFVDRLLERDQRRLRTGAP